MRVKKWPHGGANRTGGQIPRTVKLFSSGINAQPAGMYVPHNATAIWLSAIDALRRWRI
jgi:hypothetical protein